MNTVETNRKYAANTPQKHGLARGFTVIEMIIVLAVAAILLAQAMPSFSAILQKNRIRAAESDLYVALNTARNEAVKRRNTVSVCASTDGNSCVTADIDWSTGWMVFNDSNGSGTRQSGEAIIRVAPTPHGQVEMQAAGTLASFVRFNPTGDAATTAGEFRICHSDSIVNSRVISVSRVGRVSSAERDQADCNASS